ncbi:MAG: fructosamine kinase family protein [Myxococcota bacterium]|nr:fructosamine kinase family protein [Myxococcota bacterium]
MLDQIEEACGQPLENLQTISGGDICMAYRGRLKNGLSVFIKCHDNSDLLFAESKGLSWLASTHSIFTPGVIAVSPKGSEKGFLVLDWIEPGHPSLPDWENFGYALAALHRTTGEQFGWHEDNFLGTLPQKNTLTDNWILFFRDYRLLPQIKMAYDNQRIPVSIRDRLLRVLKDLPYILVSAEPPCAIHGDLWNGNVLFSRYGEPYFIDPAPYWGHRELDLAMMELFGNFHPRTFVAYGNAHPLQSGWEKRRGFYQLYYLLAHINLHGKTWLPSLESKILQIGY